MQFFEIPSVMRVRRAIRRVLCVAACVPIVAFANGSARAEIQFNAGPAMQKYKEGEIEIPLYLLNDGSVGVLKLMNQQKVLCEYPISGRGAHNRTCAVGLPPGGYMLTATFTTSPVTRTMGGLLGRQPSYQSTTTLTLPINLIVEAVSPGEEHHTAAPATAACTLDGAQRIGPQSPRNILISSGTAQAVPPPTSATYHLCNMHFHKGAEHMSPLAPVNNGTPLGYSIAAGEGYKGGYQCDRTAYLTPEQLREPEREPGKRGCENVRAGDTIEVHWVFTSCEVSPGRTLKTCTPAGQTCALRVESQIFTLVNDDKAHDFSTYAPAAKDVTRLSTMTLPAGERVVYAGSTTNKAYNTSDKCSPARVFWGVRKQCELLNVKTLHEWCEKNEDATSPFKGQTEGHDPRGLVTRQELLAPINSANSN